MALQFLFIEDRGWQYFNPDNANPSCHSQQYQVSKIKQSDCGMIFNINFTVNHKTIFAVFFRVNIK